MKNHAGRTRQWLLSPVHDLAAQQCDARAMLAGSAFAMPRDIARTEKALNLALRASVRLREVVADVGGIPGSCACYENPTRIRGHALAPDRDGFHQAVHHAALQKHDD